MGICQGMLWDGVSGERWVQPFLLGSKIKEEKSQQHGVELAQRHAAAMRLVLRYMEIEIWKVQYVDEFGLESVAIPWLEDPTNIYTCTYSV